MKWKEWANKLKEELAVLLLIFQHKNTPWYVKSMAAVTIGYALSPIDLVPDFIPVLGFLDDILVLPLLIAASIKLTPDEVVNECRKQVLEECYERPGKRWIYSVPILFIWGFVIWKAIKIFK